MFLQPLQLGSSFFSSSVTSLPRGHGFGSGDDSRPMEMKWFLSCCLELKSRGPINRIFNAYIAFLILALTRIWTRTGVLRFVYTVLSFIL